MEIEMDSRVQTRGNVTCSNSKNIKKINMELLLRKNGLIVKDKSEIGWNRLTLFQWSTQISGWLYVCKSLAFAFLIDDESEWNYYLGDWSAAIGK
jgi:hypothetical protein